MGKFDLPKELMVTRLNGSFCYYCSAAVGSLRVSSNTWFASYLFQLFAIVVRYCDLLL